MDFTQMFLNVNKNEIFKSLRPSSHAQSTHTTDTDTYADSAKHTHTHTHTHKTNPPLTHKYTQTEVYTDVYTDTYTCVLTFRLPTTC